ncbi:DUF6538 domain-containing protein [Dyella sp.]|uniref:DUF6538 domain-containing protein n=1 Tax=Dyella sp. TaxID=1869338 RepID=UPI0039C858FD
MHIPNYLRLATSGNWHFRQRIPTHLSRNASKTEITKSLRTRDLFTAQRRALALVQAYAQTFAQVGGLGLSVAKDGLPSVDEIAKAIALGYRVIVRPSLTSLVICVAFSSGPKRVGTILHFREMKTQLLGKLCMATAIPTFLSTHQLPSASNAPSTTGG